MNLQWWLCKKEVLSLPVYVLYIEVGDFNARSVRSRFIYHTLLPPYKRMEVRKTTFWLRENTIA